MKKLIITKGKITAFNEMSFKTYMKEVDKIPVLTPENEFKVAMEATNGNEDALELLVISNLKFVISVAKQYTDKNNRIEDLVNEGNLGLIIAAHKFDPTKGFKFISYGVWWIRRSIQEFKNGSGQFIRKPNNRISKLYKYREIKNSLELRLEREPTKEEIIDAMDETGDLETIAQLDIQEVCSLDKQLGEDGFSLKDTIEDGALPTDNKLMKEGVNAKMDVLLGKLTDVERTIVEMSYGLEDYPPMTLQEIGDVLNITREGVRQKRKKALFKLKVNAIKFKLSFDEFFK